MSDYLMDQYAEGVFLLSRCGGMVRVLVSFLVSANMFLAGGNITASIGYVPFPDEYLPWTIVALCVASILTIGFLYLMGWLNQKTEDLKKYEKALEEGKDPDEIDTMKTENWNHVYTIAMILGCVLSVGLALLLMVFVVPGNFNCSTYGQYILFSIGCGVLSAVVVDIFCHKLADGWLDSKVYQPLIKDKIDAQLDAWAERKAEESKTSEAVTIESLKAELDKYKSAIEVLGKKDLQ